MKPIFVRGIGLWTPGFPSARAWVNGERDSGAERPRAAMLRTRIGRYTSLTTRMAVEALEQAADQVDLSRVATVFGSTYGEIRFAFEQLDMIEADGVPSPARFKNSVHNTASGHVSISTGNMGFTTALAAGGATFAMCLVEAWVWLESKGGSIIVAVADDRLPEHLTRIASYEPIGAAFHLCSEEPGGGSRGRLSEIERRGTRSPSVEIPGSLAQNPSSAALPLIEALMKGTTGTVPVERDGEGWCVRLDSPDGIKH